jgi:multiple sugar transport system ATP-binding protein
MGMRVEIARLKAELASTMIYVTHDQVEAMTLADRIVVMNGGRIEQIGSPLELYERPANLFVAGFIGSPAMNFLKGHINTVQNSTARVRLALGPTLEIALNEELPAGAEVTLGVRPEHLRLAREGAPSTHSGQAYMVELLGSDTFIHLREAGEDIVVRDSNARHVRMGDAVTISIPPAACHLFDKAGRRVSATRESVSAAEDAGRMQ